MSKKGLASKWHRMRVGLVLLAPLFTLAFPIVATLYWRDTSVHLKRFKQDVARWIVPESVAPLEQVTVATTLKLLYRVLSLRAMFWFRLGSWAHEKRIPMLPGLLQRFIQRQFGLEIAVGADVGGGLYIAHPVGTVINVKQIGENCSIIGAATVGMNKEWVFPTLGDRVFIGIGARVLGGITLGDGAKIGANAVVLDDVPADATAVGIPARVIKRAQAETTGFNGSGSSQEVETA